VKKTLLILLCVIACFTQTIQAQTCTTAPIINTFSPNTGFIGSTVTITGANFDATTPANNKVFFGATQATVLTASFGQLTVTVPVGATTAPISVTNQCNLTAYSPVSFNGIFCPTPITSTTYQNTAFQLNGVNGAYNMTAQDLDGDGKPDVISMGTGGVSVARNTSTAGSLSFVAHNFTPGHSSVAIADMDGDGKRDIVGTSGVHRNTSTGPGNINFTYQNFGVSGYQVAVGDFNGDGKIDFITENGGTIYLNRNTSTGPGNVSFAGAVAVAFVQTTCTGLQVADVDGDGKVDILGTQGGMNRAVSVRNTTTTGAASFTFETPEYWASNGIYPYRCQIADFDKDGKIDLTTCNFNDPTNTAIFRNTSVVGNISFANAVTLVAPTGNYRIAVGDVNGDGLPDIVTKSLAVNVFSVYPNTSTGPGNISFGARFDYSSSTSADVSGIVIGDLDGDFVPDIATSGISSGNIRFHKNTSSQADNTPPTANCKSITVALSPSGTAVVTASMIDNGSSDACGIGSLQINNAASQTFTCANIGANTVTLKVTDRAGNVSTCSAVVNVAPAAIIVAGQSTVCQGQTVTLNANQGDSYQWQKDGVEIAGATAQTYIATVTGNYTVTVTNAGGCSGTSSPTAVTVNLNPTVDVTPSGVASLCAPSNTATLSASTSSIYQWKKDGVNIGGATQQNYTATTIGSYSVQVIDLFGCSATSSPVVVGATDNIRPTVRVRNLVLNMNPAKALSITAADINDGSFDNCSAVTVVLVGQAEFGCADVGKTINVQLQVTDANGNVGLATATVTITDTNKYCNQPPVAKAKALTLNAGADCTANASAEDFNDGSSDPDGDALTFSILPVGPYALGTRTVTLIVTDSKGESTFTTTTVTVVDATAPVVVNGGDVTLDAALNKCSGDAVIPALSITDNCLDIVSNTETLDEYPAGIVNRRSALWQLWPGGTSALVSTEKAFSGTKSLKVTGAPLGGPVDQLYLLGNQTSGKWNITFKMYVPAGKTGYYNLQQDETPGLSYSHQVYFRSNGTGVFQAVSSNTNFTYPQDTWFTVQLSIDQDADQATAYINNVAVKTWQYSLNTNSQVGHNKIGGFDFFPATSPLEVNPSAQPLYYVDDIKVEGAAAKIGALTARRYSVEYPVGTTPVKAIIADAAGNATESNFNVIVNDTQKPTVTPGANITVNNTTGACGANVTIPGPIVKDNCGIKLVTVSKAGFFPVGTTTITWTVTDIHNNVSTATQQITVVDVEKPVITAPAAVTTTADAGVCSAGNVALGSPVTADNCGVNPATNNAPATFPVGTTTVTWTVTDIHGNTSTATQTVTVTDNEAPKANCKPVTVTLVNGGASITVADVNNNSTDNCGIASVTISKSTFNCTNLGANTVVLTVKDIHGNVSTCNATVTVVGEIPTCSIAAVPTDNTYTGGINTNLYLGYGAQNTTLKVTAPASGAPYTYSWSGAAVNKLSSTTSGAPVFTPTVAGVYTFTVVSTNKYGCTTSCSITICVKDIRVPGTDGKKVYVCHVPPGNPGNANTLSISVNAVAAHMEHSTDKLGTCDQVCGTAPATTRVVTQPAQNTTAVGANTLSVKVETTNVSAELKASVSPNPTSSTFVVRAESSSKANVSIRILDAAGRVHEMKNAAPNTNVIMGGPLKSGAYFIEVRQGNNKQVVKGIKLN
jgi:hypothetical protein